MNNETFDLASANWAVRKIKEHLKAISDFEHQRDILIEDYQHHIEITKKICDENCDEHFRAIDNLRAKLREFAVFNIPEGKKTFKLSEGKLAFKSQPVCYRFKNGDKPSTNSQQLIDYLQANDKDFIKTLYAADWINFKRNLDFDSDTGEVFNKSTGEIISDLVADKPPDKFEVITENG